MGLAWGIGYQFFFHHIGDQDRGKAQFLFWGTFLSAWLGAKSLFLLTAGDSLSSDFVSSASFWMGGGFVFYGGLIGGALFFLLYHLIFGLSSLWVKWSVISLVLGHGIGRIGCFLAGCCYGEKTDWWWGIHLHGHERHPTQLIEALFLITLALYLKRLKSPQFVLIVYGISYGVLRFILEMLRGDQLRGEWAWGLSPSQWISLSLVILVICYALNVFRLKTK